LPSENATIGNRVRDRADAIRRLFDLDRQDAWKQWVLLITVEANRVEEEDKSQLRGYMNSIRSDSSDAVNNILDYLLDVNSSPTEQTAKLIHGVASIIIANEATNLRVYHRGTILYHGAHSQPMTHIAFEFEPTGSPLSPIVSREVALCGPIMRPTNPLNEPWFELLPEQVPGFTMDKLRNSLSFLDSNCVNKIRADKNSRSD